MKSLYPLLILNFLLAATCIFGQQTPVLFFRLTANEATQLYHEFVPSPDSSYFHTPISEKQAIQEKGHYLRVNLSGESFEASLYTTNNIRVELLNNQLDFSLLVKDTLGNNLTAAQVFLNKRAVPYDPKTQNYHLKRAPKEGILEVKIAQDIAYFKVEPKGRKISGLVTSYNRFKYTRVGGIVTFPFRFLGKPIKYLITNFRRVNWISPKEFFFRRKYRSLQGYIAFSQPVYRPGDTMRLKAFVTSPKGRPLKRNLTFTIAEKYLDDPVLVQKIRPEKPGSYIMEWPLMDTLTIDEDYTVAITHPRHKKWMNLRSKFRLEEFELDEINYEFKTTCTEFHRGEKCILQLGAKTTNGLSIPDAEAEIYLLANQIKDFNAERVLVPDTLWHNKVSLGVRGETQVVLPDSVIPAVSLILNCQVKFLNSSGQMDIKHEEIAFFSSPNLLKLELVGNEIVATTSQSMVDSCDLYTYFEENKVQRTRVHLPLKIALNPNVWKYELVNKTETAMLNLQYRSKYSSEVKAEGLRSADSIKIRIDNPRQLSIWYQVRTKTGLITEGFFQDSMLQWQNRDESPDIYYLNYQYLWAGRLSQNDKRFTYYPKILSIALEGPTQVVPGQAANFQVKVTKSNGRPGRGVDLSAGAINAQFGNKESFSIPQIGFRRQLPPRPSIEYVLRSTEEPKRLLMTRFLYHTFHLEDSLYYQYRYTSQLLSLHRDSSIRRDSFYKTVAQFAPYLVKGGKMQPIYLIYANRLLTYYYDTQDSRPYSFAAAEGYNQIIVRARDCEYVLDSVYLRKGEKLELVINEDYWQNNTVTPYIKKTFKPTYFTSEEKALINGSIFVIKNLSKEDSIFIWNTPQNIHFATYNSYNNDYKNYKVGPFPSNAFLVYLHMNHFKKSFKFEPQFNYDVSQDRERLYEYQVLPNKPNNPLLPKEISQPKLGRFIISSKAVRMFSPISSRIAYDVIPKTKSKNTGKYQFLFSNTALQNDSSRLMLIVIQNLANTEIWILEPSTRYFSPLPAGNYALFLFNQRQEVFQKNIHIGRDTLLFENLDTVSFKKMDHILQLLIGEREENLKQIWDLKNTLPYSIGKSQLIQGKITDSNGEAIIGASIVVRGSPYGTITDLDGTFQIHVPLQFNKLLISSIGFTSKEINLDHTPNSREINVVLKEDVSMLREVVVTGYSINISKALMGFSSIQQELMGRVAGVSVGGNHNSSSQMDDFGLFTVKNNTPIENGLRKNFQDHAFWQPRLRSNRWGNAQFKVQFPDDITNWKVFVIGADKNRRAGIYNGNIQSFKPLMAQLSTPRFLIYSDKTNLIGKVLNYTADTFSLQTHLNVDGGQVYQKNNRVREGLVEKMVFKTPERGDSLQITYDLETTNGYKDGEKRKIPIFPIGSIEHEGVFLLVDRDTTLNFADKKGSMQVRAQPVALPMLLEDINYLRDYPYACNEQTASKLLALLCEQKIQQALHQPLNNDRVIRSLVSRLVNAQTDEGYWGWWANGTSNIWMTNYVIQVLLQAPKSFLLNAAVESGLRWLSKTKSSLQGADRLQTLQTLILAGQWLDTLHLRDTLAKPQKLLCDRLLTLWIQQRLGFKPSIDTLMKYRKLDVYGGAFWEEAVPQNWSYSWTNHRLSNTLLAYQIAQNAGLNEEIKRISIHLLANRGYTYKGLRSGTGWRNTFEIAAAIKALTPFFIEATNLQKSTLVLSGALNTTIKQQPFTGVFSADNPLNLSLKGAGYFFFTASQERWNDHPAPKEDLFAVSTYFEQGKSVVKTLQFGKPARLVVDVDVKRESKFVMIEIPIPAGCSYDSKSNGYRFPEVHREYFPQKVSIFCEHLPIGKHLFEVDIEPRFSGTFTLNPVRIEEMYFPVLFGRNEVNQISINQE